MKPKVLLPVLVVVLALVALALWQIMRSAPPEIFSLSYTTGEIHEEASSYVIDATYPQFGIPAIDSQIKKAVEDAYAELKTFPPNPADSATPKNTFDGSFDSVYVGPDVISVELILSQYTGGAHPMTILSGLNYDRASGKQLLQYDAFKMIGLSADQISAQASAKLKADLGEAFSFPDGANTNPENFSSFLIGTSTITFVFQPYQVAAYAAGPQEVSFERKK